MANVARETRSHFIPTSAIEPPGQAARLVGYGVSSLGDGMSTVAIARLAIEISTAGGEGLAVGGALAAIPCLAPSACCSVLLSRASRRADSS